MLKRYEIRWPEVVLLLGLVTAAVCTLIFAPAAYQPAIIPILIVCGNLLRRFVGEKAEPVPQTLRPERITHVPNKRDGFARVGELVAIVAFAAAMWVATSILLAGCSSGTPSGSTVYRSACAVGRTACAVVDRVCPATSGGEIGQ